MKKTQLVTIFKFALALGLIIWLVASGHLDLESLLVILDPFYFTVSFSLVSLALLGTGIRWWILLNGVGIHLKLREVMPMQLIGFFFNFAIPGGVGGDLVKGYYIVKGNPGRKTAAAVTVLLDRVIGLYMMLLLASLAILFNWTFITGNPPIYTLSLMTIGIWVAATIGLSVAFSKKIYSNAKFQNLLNKVPLSRNIKNVFESLHCYSNSPRSLIYALLISFFSQLLTVGFFYTVGMALGETEITLGAYFFCVLVGLVATAIPISPAGIGVGQVVFLFLFNSYTKLDLDIGPTGMTIYQIFIFMWGLVGAYFYVYVKKARLPDGDR